MPIQFETDSNGDIITKPIAIPGDIRERGRNDQIGLWRCLAVHENGQRKNEKTHHPEEGFHRKDSSRRDLGRLVRGRKVFSAFERDQLRIVGERSAIHEYVRMSAELDHALELPTLKGARRPALIKWLL